MSLLTNRPRRPYWYAYLALLPGCVLGGIGLLVYTMLAGPGQTDVAGLIVAALLIFVWCGYSLAVGIVLITIYVLPMIWLLLRINLAGPVSMIFVSVLPGAALLLLGGAEYQKFSWFMLGFGLSVGISYCALAYRKLADAGK
jgi:hypothetical protein